MSEELLDLITDQQITDLIRYVQSIKWSAKLSNKNTAHCPSSQVLVCGLVWGEFGGRITPLL